jgi:hypothetical protein
MAMIAMIGLKGFKQKRITIKNGRDSSFQGAHQYQGAGL